MIHGDDSISVDLGSRTYEIPIVSHQLAHCAKLFEKWWYIRDGMSSAFCTQPPPHGSVWVAEKRNAGRPFALIVTDANVASSHAATVRHSLIADGWRCETEILPAGEMSKSPEILTKVYDRLIDLNADRRSLLSEGVSSEMRRDSLRRHSCAAFLSFRSQRRSCRLLTVPSAGRRA